MFSILRTVVWNTTKSTALMNFRNSTNLFHSLTRLQHPQQITSTPNKLLAPTNVLFTPNCGFKVKVVLKRRCKDCYFVKRQNRLYVICETHPRHKQMQSVKKEKNTWILSHATQSKFRPW